MKYPDAAFVYESLLRHNYFPMVKEAKDEIPPLLSSEGLTPAIADAVVSAGSPRGAIGFDLIEYRTTRFNNIVRRLDIPHPFPYFRLCQLLRDHWPDLHYICTNTRSRIKPEKHNRRVIVMDEYDDPQETEEPERIVVMERTQFPSDLILHLDMTANAKYMVDADVANCFPSIYSHSLPWALVGHAKAKNSRADSSKWYNKLDERLRNIRRGETQGVPIGPGTSAIACEIVLAKVDEELEKRGYTFSRWIDDYKCFTNTRDKAEKFVRDLERELDRYLLRLNAKKVAISRLPLPHTASWLTQFSVAVSSTEVIGAREITSLLGYALELQCNTSDGSVMKYAAKVLTSNLNKQNSAIFLRYILAQALHFPVLLPIAASVLEKYSISCDETHLRRLLKEHLRFRRSDAVAWLIYIFYLSKKRLGSQCAEAIVKAGDCVAMACMIATGKYVGKVKRFLQDLNASDPSEYEVDQHWLSVHELSMIDKEVCKLFKEYNKDSQLALLQKRKVSFLRRPALKSLRRVTAVPIPR